MKRVVIIEDLMYQIYEYQIYEMVILNKVIYFE